MIEEIEFEEIIASYAFRGLRNFPKCGVRYQGFNGHSLILIHPDLEPKPSLVTNRINLIENIPIVRAKIEASKIKSKKSTRVCIVPRRLTKRRITH